MTTTRFDHTACRHTATPAGRKACRARRTADIREAQDLFKKAWDTNATPEIREYEATVDTFAFRWNMTMADAFDLIENGPVVF